MNQFQLAGGSVQGRDHLLVSKKNNQDAWGIHQAKDLIVAVVADGCGSRNSPQSEVGAGLGVPLLIQIIIRNAQHSLSFVKDPFGEDQLPIEKTDFWQTVRKDFLAQLRVLARAMGVSMTQVVNRYFLFTTLGVLITPAKSVFFRIGDGEFNINGERYKFDSGDENEPVYIAYDLIQTSLQGDNPSELEFQILCAMPTNLLMNFAIATDGIDYLVKAENKLIPGTQNEVGPLSQFWTDDKYFSNSGAVTQRLLAINRETQKVDWTAQRIQKIAGLLRDDTTLVVGRRVPEVSDAN